MTLGLFGWLVGFPYMLNSLGFFALFVFFLFVHTKHHLNCSIQLPVSGLIRVLSSVVLSHGPR